MATSILGRARSARRFSETLKNFWLDIVLFFAFIIDWNLRFTGLAIHEWLGIGLGVLLVYHLLVHWSWIVAVGKRLAGRLHVQERLKVLLDILLFVNMVILIASGLLISEVALRQVGIHAEAGFVWRRLHTLSADWILWLMGLHLAFNWRWITNAFRRYVWQPLARPFTSH
ncbi:MAG TPA: hypothetical protein DCL15_02245 [Chloroflexi bacterium]|nr:hypothetical protein [Chloroflexota bacterium]HHW86416.1 DUF4405 domain-containing protein [Chloroflexota bacterium]